MMNTTMSPIPSPSMGETPVPSFPLRKGEGEGEGEGEGGGEGPGSLSGLYDPEPKQ